MVAALQSTPWSLFTPVLTSSYSSWGLGHLDRDTDEIAKCISFIQEYKTSKHGNPGKIVLMGHSTGSQCVLHYLSRPNPHTSRLPFDPDLEHVVRPVLDGAIMQAPVSDREAVQWVIAEGFLGKTPAELKHTYEVLLQTAREAVAKSPEVDVPLPMGLTAQFGYTTRTPLSARRFLSLVSPESPARPSGDDLFSSDLGDDAFARTFGQVRKGGLLRERLVVLMSGADQAVPDWVDKEKLLARFQAAADKGAGPGEGPVWDAELSGIIPGASHALSNDDQAEPRRLLVGKVVAYLERVAKG